MSEVVKRGERFGACVAPSDADAGSAVAKTFGLLAEALITANYVKKMKGSIPATIWTDRVPGPSLPPNPAFFVPPQVLSMFAWLAARNPGLMARAAEFAQFFQDVGFASAVPDIIDQTGLSWYEIKPGSPTGIVNGAKKLLNIPIWMLKFNLPYIPGVAYTPDESDDVDLLAHLPSGFRNFIKMMASRIGGIEDIKIVLSFRRTAPGLILYWICVTLRRKDRDAEAEDVSAFVLNVVRWTAVHAFRAANGVTLDPAQPIQVTAQCPDATIRDCFLPGNAGLIAAILRSPPAIGYSVLGGSLAEKMLRRADEMKALVDRLFLPLPQTASGAMFSRSDAQILAIGGLIIIGIALVALTVWVAAPIVVAALESGGAAAAATTTAAATEAPVLTALESQVPTVAQELATTAGGALERQLAEQGTRTVIRLASRTAAREAVKTMGRAATVMFFIGASRKAFAGTLPGAPPPPGGGATPGSFDLEQSDTVWLNPFGTPLLLGPDDRGGDKFTPRQRIGSSIYLYDIRVADFPELHAQLAAGPSDQLIR